MLGTVCILCFYVPGKGHQMQHSGDIFEAEAPQKDPESEAALTCQVLPSLDSTLTLLRTACTIVWVKRSSQLTRII